MYIADWDKMEAELPVSSLDMTPSKYDMPFEAVGQVILTVTVLGGLAFREQIATRLASLEGAHSSSDFEYSE
ncbi:MULTISPECIES: hypothetical protein [Halorussus]|uniref:Uncharacterized protein n=2 Tax=Halorussus TaxID=1070314 RepID=A0A8U0I1E4_9EURY|nr:MULTISPECIES: hypothetical protein [Halorussus]UPV77185.1 hypothetical protein M0R89_22700 [Halorussus limi]